MSLGNNKQIYVHDIMYLCMYVANRHII